MANDPLPSSVVEDMRQASEFFRRTERLSAPRERREMESPEDHAARELKSAAHEAWYVAQDANLSRPGPAVDRAAAEIAATGRPAVDAEAVLAKVLEGRTPNRPTSRAKGPAVAYADVAAALGRPGRER